MQCLLFTPAKRRTVALFAALLYLALPAVYYAECATELWLRPNPNADSWEIFWRWHLPLFVAVLAAFAPAFVLLVGYALRDYPGRVSLLTFNRDRSAWTIAWSLLLGGLAMSELAEVAGALAAGQVIVAANLLLWTHLFLCLRCSVVHARFFERCRAAATR